MQPYFLPYIGYFQLIAAADVFVVYDDIQYTKRGWINRNRLLRDGAAVTFSLPLQKAPAHLDVRERTIAREFVPEKLLNTIAGAYRGAPRFAATLALMETVLRFEDRNLFGFLHHSICRVCEALGISTPIEISSRVGVEPGLRGEERVRALCHAVGAGGYVNPIGGTELYSRRRFADDGIALEFLRSVPRPYAQSGGEFVPFLSILDVLMFNSIDAVRGALAADYVLE